MFGCYRRGDANDPDTYVAAIASVLSRYDLDVIREVTDPFSGIPSRKKENGYSGLPDVADVKDACEGEASRRARIAELGAVKARPFFRLSPPQVPGYRANLLVLKDAPQYAAMVERSKKPDTSVFDWKFDEQVRGIWVRADWMSNNRHKG